MPPARRPGTRPFAASQQFAAAQQTAPATPRVTGAVAVRCCATTDRSAVTGPRVADGSPPRPETSWTTQGRVGKFTFAHEFGAASGESREIRINWSIDRFDGHVASAAADDEDESGEEEYQPGNHGQPKMLMQPQVCDERGARRLEQQHQAHHGRAGRAQDDVDQAVPEQLREDGHERDLEPNVS